MVAFLDVSVDVRPVAAVQSRPKRRTEWFLPGAVLATILIATSIVPSSVGVGDTAGVLLSPLRSALASIGITLPEYSTATTGLVLGIRLPRVVLAAIVGASLALAGAVMQAVFRNPLAEPGVTGVSSGAATAAVMVIVFGGPAWALPTAAFLGAIAAVLVVQLIAGIRGGAGATLLLVGIAINAFLGAVISATLANAPTSDDAQQAMFWMNGDLTSSNWDDVKLIVIPIIIGMIILMTMIPELNLFLLGEEQAASTGVNVGRTRHILLGLAALVTACGVAVTGVISFVGLVVPHLIRLIYGSDHRRLMPLAMGFGAIFLVIADLVARNLMNSVILQTGTVTALVGAPVLLYLVARKAGS